MSTTKKTLAAKKVSEGEHKCDHEGCTASFPSAQALRMHKMRKHEYRAQKPDGEPKRKTRKVSPNVNYCPCCGLNLSSLQIALQVAARHS